VKSCRALQLFECFSLFQWNVNKTRSNLGVSDSNDLVFLVQVNNGFRTNSNQGFGNAYIFPLVHPKFLTANLSLGVPCSRCDAEPARGGERRVAVRGGQTALALRRSGLHASPPARCGVLVSAGPLRKRESRHRRCVCGRRRVSRRKEKGPRLETGIPHGAARGRSRWRASGSTTHRTASTAVDTPACKGSA
jgi:hypothetical protein